MVPITAMGPQPCNLTYFQKSLLYAVLWGNYEHYFMERLPITLSEVSSSRTADMINHS